MTKNTRYILLQCTSALEKGQNYGVLPTYGQLIQSLAIVEGSFTMETILLLSPKLCLLCAVLENLWSALVMDNCVIHWEAELERL